METYRKYSSLVTLTTSLVLATALFGCGGSGTATTTTTATAVPVTTPSTDTSSSSSSGGGGGDVTAPTATATTETIANTANTNVQSTEVGTAYLVNTSVVVANLASITGAADASWNQVAIAAANTPTALAAAGLSSGTYKVYAVDAAGNLSAASAGTVTIPFPLTAVAGAFNGGAGNETFSGTFTDGDAASTFDAGDVIVGGGGTDSLHLISQSVGAMTLTGPNWNAGDSGLTSLVIRNTAAGTIGLTAGGNFNTAYSTGHLNLTTTGDDANPTTVVLTAYAGTATIVATEVGAGLIDITTGAGASTVSATNTAAGGETVNGTGLTSVTLVSGGAGAQTIGSVGLTNSLTSITTTQNGSGALTATSTSATAVTVSATNNGTAGGQTIVTAGGNDTITLLGTYTGSVVSITAGAGTDTLTLLTGHAGINTIVQTTASTGVPTTTNFDSITNYNKALDNIGCTTLILPTASVGGIGVATISAVTGIATFNGADTTFAQHLAAVVAGVGAGAGETVIWQEGVDSYIFISDGAAGATATDVLIKLVNTTTGALTIAGNKITAIA